MIGCSGILTAFLACPHPGQKRRISFFRSEIVDLRMGRHRHIVNCRFNSICLRLESLRPISRRKSLSKVGRLPIPHPKPYPSWLGMATRDGYIHSIISLTIWNIVLTFKFVAREEVNLVDYFPILTEKLFMNKTYLGLTLPFPPTSSEEE